MHGFVPCLTKTARKYHSFSRTAAFEKKPSGKPKGGHACIFGRSFAAVRRSTLGFQRPQMPTLGFNGKPKDAHSLALLNLRGHSWLLVQWSFFHSLDGQTFVLDGHFWAFFAGCPVVVLSFFVDEQIIFERRITIYQHLESIPTIAAAHRRAALH